MNSRCADSLPECLGEQERESRRCLRSPMRFSRRQWRSTSISGIGGMKRQVLPGRRQVEIKNQATTYEPRHKRLSGRARLSATFDWAAQWGQTERPCHTNAKLICASRIPQAPNQANWFFVGMRHRSTPNNNINTSGKQPRRDGYLSIVRSCFIINRPLNRSSLAHTWQAIFRLGGMYRIYNNKTRRGARLTSPIGAPKAQDEPK